MRFVICVLALCVMASVAMADPNGPSIPKYWYYTQHDIRSTYPEAEPNDTCGTDQQMVCGDVVSPAYLDAGTQDWYVWNANAGDVMTMWTGEVNPGDTCDTYLELYANDCSTMLAYNDDFGSLYSRIENFVAPYTGVYHMKVRGWSSGSYGPYAYHLECGTPPPPPENDQCSGAIEIPRCTAGQVAGDLYPFINDYDPSIPGPSCTGYSAAGKDAVYFSNVQAGDHISLVYGAPSFDASIYIVTDCSQESATCLAGADDTVAPDPEVIEYTFTGSGTVYIICDAYGSNTGGAFTLDYNIICASLGACCVDEVCTMTYEADCQGTWHGGQDCATFTCPPVATQKSSWGQIKSTYR